MKFNIKINRARLNLDNLFGGDPILGMLLFNKFREICDEYEHHYICIMIDVLSFKLGPASNEILNANSEFLIDEIKPVLEESLSDLFTSIANKITGQFTYDDLFPKN